jgi:hypothetical protein
LAAEIVLGDRPLVDAAPYSHNRFIDGRKPAPAGLF